MKNNIEYYRHTVDAHEHWKFKVLRKTYGWAGDGKFWALNNMIGKSKGCILVMESKAKEAAIAVELDFTPAELKAFLRFLVDECELLLEQNGGYTNNMIQEVFEGVEEKRETERMRKQRTAKKKQDKAEPELMNVSVTKSLPAESVVLPAENDKSGAENEQSKLNETKVNKSIADSIVLHNTILKNMRAEENKPPPLGTVPLPPPHELIKYSIKEREGFMEFSDWIRNKAPCVALMEEPFTIDQYLAIGNTHKVSIDAAKHLLIAMHNWPQLHTKNRSAYLAFLKFLNAENNYREQPGRRRG